MRIDAARDARRCAVLRCGPPVRARSRFISAWSGTRSIACSTVSGDAAPVRHRAARFRAAAARGKGGALRRREGARPLVQPKRCHRDRSRQREGWLAGDAPPEPRGPIKSQLVKKGRADDGGHRPWSGAAVPLLAGSGRGVFRYTAARMASRGHPKLAMAMFRYPALPAAGSPTAIVKQRSTASRRRWHSLTEQVPSLHSRGGARSTTTHDAARSGFYSGGALIQPDFRR